MKLYTAQYHYDGPNRVDITARTTEEGHIFKPDWFKMVKPYKDGRMSKEEYTRLYRAKMKDSIIRYAAEWVKFVLMEEITVVCYCKPGDFCHRIILKDILLEEYGQFVTYEGERNIITGGIYK